MAENNNTNWEEFARANPEYIKKKKLNRKQMSFLCQCKSGHTFDYRNRKRYSKDNPHYAPCQGVCPYCGDDFTFIGNENNIYTDTRKRRKNYEYY